MNLLLFNASGLHNVLLSGVSLGVFIPVLVIALLAGVIGGFFLRVKLHEKSLKETSDKIEKMLEDASKEAEQLKKDKIIETKQETYKLMSECNNDIKERKAAIKAQEDKLQQRENSLDNRSNNLDKREENLDRKEQSIDDRKSALEEKHIKLDAIIKGQEDKLYEISQYSLEEARSLILSKTEEEMKSEIAQYIRDEEDKARETAEKKSKEILASAIQKYAQEVTNERTVSVVQLPSDEMKGRIIGREGRNIRTIESLTGVDLIVDDTPESIVLSCFDPIRREVARRAIAYLVEDGRIHPARIEEMVERSRAEVNQFIRECGDKAIFEVGVGKIHPDLVKILGRLQFRTSYGQNVLQHSIEVAFFAGKMAAELGEDETLAKRAGLLHDIGKAIDHEVEGSHVELGASLAKKYKENPVVINAIESHHGDVPADNIISCLVQAADALSAARPGARSESLENYINRLESLEGIANNVKGVDNSYAIQAGREIRILVKPDEVSDDDITLIARDVKNQIEENLTYPGTIKVTVVREKRVQEIAK